ncbi:MAG: hypothetical protein DDT26_00325 [Dehalococcoidia bacterium]|nr:hypothetical protein [Chloroflexota bacterium]
MTFFKTSTDRDYLSFKSLVESRLVELADAAIEDETEGAAKELFNGVSEAVDNADHSQSA